MSTRLYKHSAMANDRLPTAATATFEVDRYMVAGKKLHEAIQRVSTQRPAGRASAIGTHSLLVANA